MTTATSGALSAAADSIHQAALSIAQPDALDDPAGVAAALAELHRMTGALPHLVKTISARLEAAHEAGKVAHAHGGDPAGPVTLTCAHLTTVEEAFGMAARWLGSAQNTAANLKAAE